MFLQPKEQNGAKPNQAAEQYSRYVEHRDEGMCIHR